MPFEQTLSLESCCICCALCRHQLRPPRAQCLAFWGQMKGSGREKSPRQAAGLCKTSWASGMCKDQAIPAAKTPQGARIEHPHAKAGRTLATTATLPAKSHVPSSKGHQEQGQGPAPIWALLSAPPSQSPWGEQGRAQERSPPAYLSSGAATLRCVSITLLCIIQRLCTSSAFK